MINAFYFFKMNVLRKATHCKAKYKAVMVDKDS